MKRYDVVIAGAGICGLTAALCLARGGHRVRVFEAVADLKPLGVGINLLPHSVRELASLGLTEALEATAIRTSTLRYHTKHGLTIWNEPRGVAAGYDWPQYSIHRGKLQAILLDAVKRELGADALVTGHRLVSVAQDRAGITVTCEDPAGAQLPRVRADLLIGADGLMSRVRAQFYPDEGNPVYSGQLLWRAVSVWPQIFDGRTMLMIGHDALKAVVYPIADLGDGTMLTNWIAERRIPQDLPTNKGDWNRLGRLDDFLPFFEDWRFDWLNVPGLFRAAEEVWEFPMVDRDPVERWSFGSVTLAGDAAHPMRPNGSNGASQAILDGVALEQALRAHDDPVAALAAYESERLDRTARLTLANRQAGPEQVLELVEARCPDGFEDLHTHVSLAELEAIAENYKRLAGFSLRQLQQREAQ